MTNNAVFRKFIRNPLSELLNFSHFVQLSWNCCLVNQFLQVLLASVTGFHSRNFQIIGFQFSWCSRAWSVIHIKITIFKTMELVHRTVHVPWNSILPKNRANWVTCLQLFFFAETHAEPNIKLFVAHRVHCYFVRLCAPLNHKIWRFK